MRPVLRIVLYVALAATALVCGQRFLSGYARAVRAAAAKYDAPEPANPATTGSHQQPAETTNASPAEPAATPGSEGTNAPASELTNAPAAGLTNALTPDTTQAPTVAATQPARPPRSAAPGTTRLRGNFRTWDAFLTLAAVLTLAFMLARDLSQFVGSRAHRALYNDEGEGLTDPEYERAEQVWADGDYLETVRLMREYLTRNPRQVHVSLRIAEIYEKDLHNHLAAALEYEEILKCRLESERWGWAAIHLCNLYNRLNQPDKAEALLRRIVKEYGSTAAAAKARERLGSSPDQPGEETAERATPAETSGFKLPPGFRPKKR